MPKYIVTLLSPYASWPGVEAPDEATAIAKCPFPKDADSNEGPYRYVAEELDEASENDKLHAFVLVDHGIIDDVKVFMNFYDAMDHAIKTVSPLVGYTPTGDRDTDESNLAEAIRESEGYDYSVQPTELPDLSDVKAPDLHKKNV